MGSTFWAELYFRLPKRNNVLLLITKYLLQYKRVCIPHVGTFELVQEPPQLDVADKIFTPPSFTTRFLHHDAVPDHQFLYLESSVHSERETLKQELSRFGQNLKTRIEKDPFRWNGFGTLRYHSDELVFEPQPIRLTSLQRLRADKVIRQNVAHNVIIGDQHITSEDIARPVDRQGYKMPWYMIVGWILLALSILAILWILYLNNFQDTASGQKRFPDLSF